MENLGEQTISINADVGDALSGIDDVQSALDDLEDKTVTVTTRYVEEHAGGGWGGGRGYVFWRVGVGCPVFVVGIVFRRYWKPESSSCGKSGPECLPVCSIS